MGGVVPASSLIRYEPFSAVPCMVFEGGSLPVVLRFVDDEDVAHFAKGGLVSKAHSVRAAGRYGDDQLIHVNSEELAELKRLWGEPTINPETGLPEFFLGGLFKKLKKLFKPLAKILPVAAAFIPGIGPVASAAIGAASGALGGGGIKGALLGGALGAAGPGLGSKIGSSVLGAGASPMATSAVGNAVLGAGKNLVMGGDPLKGALTGAATGALYHPPTGLNPQLPGPNAPTTLPTSMSSAAPLAAAAPAPTMPGASVPAMPSPVTPSAAPDIDAPPSPVSSVSPLSALTASPAASTTAPATSPLAAKPNSMFGIPNKIALPLAVAAMLGLSKKKKKSSSTDPMSRVPSSYNDPLPPPRGIFGSLGAKTGMPRSAADLAHSAEDDSGEKSYFDYAARGGAAGSNLRVSRSKAVKGAGDGRSDSIKAMLSDGEYVMDAETVALLGNGSSRAGAKALDQFRTNVRRHKGRNLAAGKFSAKAKTPDSYLNAGAK